MTETLQHLTNESALSPEELDAERLEIINNAFAGLVLDLCSGDRGYNFGDPLEALTRADSTANID